MGRDSLANLMAHAREITAGPGETLLLREQGSGSDNGDETVFPFCQPFLTGLHSLLVRTPKDWNEGISEYIFDQLLDWNCSR